MEKYLKYYWLEREYLEKEIQPFVREGLEPEHFFAIVIWKRNASKTKIRNSLLKKNINIKTYTKELYGKTREEKIKMIRDIGQIGISIASAILTICYPDEFTVVDYRSCNSLWRLIREDGEDIKRDYPLLVEYLKLMSIKGDGNIDNVNNINKDVYFQYVDACKKMASKYCVKSLRDFDRLLWGMDFYDGKNGLKELSESYKRELAKHV